MRMRLLVALSLLSLLSANSVASSKAKNLDRNLLGVSSGLNFLEAPDSDELIREPDGLELHHNGIASSPVIGWPDSDVEILHPAPDASRMGQIVGGRDADSKMHPYQLQLAYYGDQVCGAVVIDRWWAVTAAHCLYKDGSRVETSAVRLRAGATYYNTGGRVHYVSKVIVHKQYNHYQELDYDIALLKVGVPFVLSATVQKIALPPFGQGVPEGAMGVVSGWGSKVLYGNESVTLQNVYLPVVSHKKCKASYRKKCFPVTTRMLCAGFPARGLRQNFCYGDSGGPFAVNGTLVGIVSWSLGCALPGYPGVFTRISKFRTWIKITSGV